MPETPVCIESGGQQVVGMFHHPGGTVPAPAVLMIHGFTGDKIESYRVFVRTARRLALAGIAVLRIDCRGSGDSEGEFLDMTISTEVEDARNGLVWLRSHDEVNGGQIGILGYSMGSLVAVTLLADDEALRTGVLWSPVAHPSLMVQARRYPGWEQHLEEHGAVFIEAWAVGKRLVEEMRTFDPLETAQAIRAPILIVHGDQDESVPVGASDEYENVFKASGIQHEKVIVPGAVHGYATIAHQETLQASTVEWFSGHLI
jgi:dipeptidyl aminopeptidase/acylaminoacyl peptidase